MTKTIHAIYKNGLLNPLDPIEGIKENTEVEITITLLKGVSQPIMRSAGILSEEDADNMMRTVEEEFAKVNPDEWKD